MASSTAVTADLRAIAVLLARGYLRSAEKGQNGVESPALKGLDVSAEESAHVPRLLDAQEAS